MRPPRGEAQQRPSGRRFIHALAWLAALSILAGCAGTVTGERIRAGLRDRAAPRTTPRPNAAPAQQGELVPAPARPVKAPQVGQAQADYEIDTGLPQYRPGSNMAGMIKTRGSSTLTTLLNLWSEDFRRIHPRVDLEITGGGSSAAMRPLLAGTSDIAPMSRELNERELASFRERWGYEPRRLTVHPWRCAPSAERAEVRGSIPACAGMDGPKGSRVPRRCGLQGRALLRAAARRSHASRSRRRAIAFDASR